MLNFIRRLFGGRPGRSHAAGQGDSVRTPVLRNTTVNRSTFINYSPLTVNGLRIGRRIKLPAKFHSADITVKAVGRGFIDARIIHCPNERYLYGTIQRFYFVTDAAGRVHWRTA